MTDNEIIKALKCCKGDAVPCSGCIYADFGQCQTYMADDALKLINRQKAEIERLTRENIALNRTAIPSSGTIFKVGNALLFAENKEDYDITINTIKTEAYKELAEMLKERAETQQVHYSYRDIVEVRDIDNVLKKLTEKGGKDNAR